MARSYAPIILSVWRNAEFTALDTEAQRLYFLLISQPNIDYCGVLPYMPRRWSKLAKGATAARLKRAAADLEAAKFITIDTHTEELWVRSFVKHNGVLTQPNVAKAMRSAFENIASLSIRQAFYISLPIEEQKRLPSPFPPDDPQSNGKPQAQGEGLEEPLAEGFAEPVDPTRGLGISNVSSGFDLDPNLQPKPGPSSSSPAQNDDDERPPESAFIEARRRLAERPPHLPRVLDPQAWLERTAEQIWRNPIEPAEDEHTRQLRIAEEAIAHVRGAAS